VKRVAKSYRTFVSEFLGNGLLEELEEIYLFVVYLTTLSQQPRPYSFD
jgi:hypothetical protein